MAEAGPLNAVLLLVVGIGFLLGREVLPGLRQARDGLFARLIVEDFEDLRGDGLDLFAVCGETFHALGEVAIDEGEEGVVAALVDAADDGDALDLLRGQFAMGAIDLGEDVAGVDEEDAFVRLALVEESEGGRQGDHVEHVRRQGEHAVDEVVLDQGSGRGRPRRGGRPRWSWP